MAVKNWARQLTHNGEPLPGEVPYANQDLLIESVKESLEAGKTSSGRSPKVLVIGAVRSLSSILCIIHTNKKNQLGRCGNGAVQLAKDVGVPESNIIQWDMAETAKGEWAQKSVAYCRLQFSC